MGLFTFKAQPDITRSMSQAIKKIIPDHVSKVSGFENKAVGRNLAREITNPLREKKIASVLQSYQRAVSAVLGEPSQSEIPAELNERYKYLISPLYDSTLGKEHREWQESPCDAQFYSAKSNLADMFTTVHQIQAGRDVTQHPLISVCEAIS